MTASCFVLHPGFLSFLADYALRVLEIIRKFDDSGRPTPAASIRLTWRSAFGEPPGSLMASQSRRMP